MRRLMLLSASAVFVLGGLILAFLPFHITIDVPEPRAPALTSESAAPAQ